MKIWANILSACPQCAGETLPKLALSTRSVSVFSTVDNRFVGHTLRLEIRDAIDLWAELELDDNASRFRRAAAVLTRESPDSIQIVAVLATDLPRDAIRRLTMVSN